MGVTLANEVGLHHGGRVHHEGGVGGGLHNWRLPPDGHRTWPMLCVTNGKVTLHRAATEGLTFCRFDRWCRGEFCGMLQETTLDGTPGPVVFCDAIFVFVHYIIRDKAHCSRVKVSACSARCGSAPVGCSGS